MAGTGSNILSQSQTSRAGVRCLVDTKPITP